MIVPLLIAFGIAIGGWSFLSVLGNERQRLIDRRRVEAEIKARSEAPVGEQVAR